MKVSLSNKLLNHLLISHKIVTSNAEKLFKYHSEVTLDISHRTYHRKPFSSSKSLNESFVSLKGVHWRGLPPTSSIYIPPHLLDENKLCVWLVVFFIFAPRSFLFHIVVKYPPPFIVRPNLFNKTEYHGSADFFDMWKSDLKINLWIFSVGVSPTSQKSWLLIDNILILSLSTAVGLSDREALFKEKSSANEKLFNVKSPENSQTTFDRFDQSQYRLH